MIEGRKQDQLRAELLQRFGEGLLLVAVKLGNYLGLQQCTRRGRCARIGASCHIDKFMTYELLKLGKNLALSRLGRNESKGQRDGGPPDGDPGFIRRGLVRHREQIK